MECSACSLSCSRAEETKARRCGGAGAEAAATAAAAAALLTDGGGGGADEASFAGRAAAADAAMEMHGVHDATFYVGATSSKSKKLKNKHKRR